MKNNNYGHPDMFSKPFIVTLQNKWFEDSTDTELLTVNENKMNMIEQLKEKGFKVSPKKHYLKEGQVPMIYEFSDFELLEFYASEADAPCGKVLVIEDLQLSNPFTEEIYATINYELRYKTVDEFLGLLKGLGYGI